MEHHETPCSTLSHNLGHLAFELVSHISGFSLYYCFPFSADFPAEKRHSSSLLGRGCGCGKRETEIVQGSVFRFNTCISVACMLLSAIFTN